MRSVRVARAREATDPAALGLDVVGKDGDNNASPGPALLHLPSSPAALSGLSRALKEEAIYNQNDDTPAKHDGGDGGDGGGAGVALATDADDGVGIDIDVGGGDADGSGEPASGDAPMRTMGMSLSKLDMGESRVRPRARTSIMPHLGFFEVTISYEIDASPDNSNSNTANTANMANTTAGSSSHLLETTGSAFGSGGLDQDWGLAGPEDEHRHFSMRHSRTKYVALRCVGRPPPSRPPPTSHPPPSRPPTTPPLNHCPTATLISPASSLSLSAPSPLPPPTATATRPLRL